MGSDKYLTTLIVDDNSVNLMLLKATLVKAGYHILMVNNGPEARAMAAKCWPDLILLDIMMPGEDGFEVMRRLRENSKTVAIPIIFFSAPDDPEAKMEGFKLGAVDYIIKPFLCARGSGPGETPPETVDCNQFAHHQSGAKIKTD